MIGMINKKIIHASRRLHERDRKYAKNVAISIVLQFFAFCGTIFITPLALGFLDQERFGIWLVVSSCFNWISVFNIGLGCGLRNKLAESLACGELDSSRKIVSTTFFLIGLIAAGCLMVFFIIYPFISWSNVMNVDISMQSEVNHVVLVCAMAFILRLLLSIMMNILEADQNIGLIKLFPFLTNLTVVASLVFARVFLQSSLLVLCIVILVPEIVVYAVLNLYFFGKRYKAISPKLSEIDLSLGRLLIGMGFKFFIIQITMIIIYSTDNIIISRLFNPALVTPYNISFQYMGFASSFFFLLLSPSLAAFSEANIKNDNNWIIHTIKRLIIIWLIFCLALLLLVILSPVAYRVWIGDSVIIPMNLTILMAVHAAVQSWNNIFGSYVSGAGKINVSVITGIIISALNIPVSIFLARDAGLGLNGVITGSILCLSIVSVVIPAQSYLIITRKARWIWNT